MRFQSEKESPLSAASRLADDATTFLSIADNAEGYAEETAAAETEAGGYIANMRKCLVLAAQSALFAAQNIMDDYIQELMPEEEENDQ